MEQVPNVCAAPVRGVIFDLDGTLVTVPLDFEAMRREIGLPPGTPLLEAVEGMGGPEKTAALEVLARHECAAAHSATVNPGVAEFLDWLTARSVPRAILTRNRRDAVTLTLARCGLAFDLVLAREDAPYKPSPEGLWQICARWQLRPDEVLMIGDYLYDLQVGRNAGTRTALVTHGRSLPFAHLADFVFPSFEEMPEALLRLIAHAR
jgi:HAD superfamily hydrolase (TIGR01509 family)